MPPPYIAVKNLEKYQHYKHRNPPWVKLHYSLLDDPAFISLDEVQQCRYIKLIMLASRQMNCISTDPEYLGRVMRIGEPVDLTPLIDVGFLLASRKRSASKMLAPPHENRPQSRVEKSRVEKEPPLPPLGGDWFHLFWKAYPKKKSKGDAEKAWKVLKPTKDLLQVILAAIERAKNSPDWMKDGGQFIPHPGTWLRRKGWEDEDFILLTPADPYADNPMGMYADWPSPPAEDFCIHGWGLTPELRIKHGDRADHECGQCHAEARKAAESEVTA